MGSSLVQGIGCLVGEGEAFAGSVLGLRSVELPVFSCFKVDGPADGAGISD